jgi:hypothetical protein
MGMERCFHKEYLLNLVIVDKNYKDKLFDDKRSITR